MSGSTVLLFFYVLHSPILMDVYRDMVRGVLFAPLTYFDTTPVARILHRLSADLGLLDKIVLVEYFAFTGHAAYALCFVLSIAYAYALTQHYVLLVVFALFLAAVLYKYSKFLSAVKAYRQAEEELKIPIGSYFSEVVQGQATIRAFGKTGEKEEAFCRLEEQYGRTRAAVNGIDLLISFLLSFASTLYLLLLLANFFYARAYTSYDIFLLVNILSMEEYLQRVN